MVEIKNIKFMNLTPHALNVVVDGSEYVLPSEGLVRVSSTEKPIDSLFSVTEYGEVTGLPEPAEGVMYIVSGLVFGATDRKDVVAPNTGSTAIRNEAGQIQAVRGFLIKG